MKNALVNEDINQNGTDWSVSFDGYNTGDNSQTVICANKDEAFKLKAIIDDLKEKLSFVIADLNERLDQLNIIEHDKKMQSIIRNIEAIYL